MSDHAPGIFDHETPLAERLMAFWAWVQDGHCYIKDRRGRYVAMKPNRLQERLFARMLRMAKANKPIRMIILKSRKLGCSTLLQALAYYLTKTTQHYAARVVAHTDDATIDIYQIAARIARHEDVTPKDNAINWKDHDSRLTVRTAGGHYISSGDTTDYLHMSELPKWQGSKAKIKDQLASLFGSVPLEPHTIVVIESTANMTDEAGEFENLWNLSEQEDSAYENFFVPWIEEPAYRSPVREPIVDHSDYEQWMLGLHPDLDDEQIQFHREKLQEFGGDLIYWKQEYPLTAEEAFQSPSGRVYAMLSEKTHQLEIDPDDLITAGYDVYRAIDFGGANPFVCLWIAHLPNVDKPAFTIDPVCENTWREARGYRWGRGGKPHKDDDHTCDAFRYAVMHYQLFGHVHIYRELYVPDHARLMQSELDMAKRVLALSREPVRGSVADRSRPATIRLFQQAGVFTVPNRVPDRVSEYGEINDGVTRVKALMTATGRLRQPSQRPPWEEVNMRRHRRRRVEAARPAPKLAPKAPESESKTHPIFGAYG